MAVKRKDGYQGDLSLCDFISSAFAAFEVDVLQIGDSLRCAQLSAQLSAELCSPDWGRFHITLRCTESIHFLNITFSGLLLRP